MKKKKKNIGGHLFIYLYNKKIKKKRLLFLPYSRENLDFHTFMKPDLFDFKQLKKFMQISLDLVKIIQKYLPKMVLWYRKLEIGLE